MPRTQNKPTTKAHEKHRHYHYAGEYILPKDQTEGGIYKRRYTRIDDDCHHLLKQRDWAAGSRCLAYWTVASSLALDAAKAEPFCPLRVFRAWCTENVISEKHYLPFGHAPLPCHAIIPT